MASETEQQTGSPKRRFDRGSRLALSVVALLAVASLAVTIAVLARPGDGCVLNIGADTVQLGACVGGWPTPLRPGDTVVAVDGIAQLQDVTIRQPPAPAGWVDGGTARYTVERGAGTLDLEVPLRRMGWPAILRAWGYGLTLQWPFWHIFALAGAIVTFALRPRARAAQLLLVALGGLCAVTVLTAPTNTVGVAFVPAPVWYAGLFLNLCWAWLFAPTLLLLLLSFPRRVWPLAHRPRLTVALIFGLPLAATAASFVSSDAFYYLVALGLGALGVVVAAAAVTLHTFLRVRDPVVRAQTGWLAFGIALGLAPYPVGFVLGFVFPGLDQAMARLPWWLSLLQVVPIVAFPLCLGIAITRYRLFDIELVLNRALVYAALTACVVGLYMLVVGYLGWLFRARENLALSLIATGIVAVVFAPLRALLQRGVNRLMYGERDEPYRLLTRLGRQLESTLQPATALALTVETVARALKLPYVAIVLEQAGTLQTVAAYGSVRSDASRVPLVYAGAPIGELVAASRAPHEVFTSADQRLLHDLARHIGVAAHAVALAADLEQARVRLVTERGEARRRLGSDLHDGVGHRLAGLTRQSERVMRALEDDAQLAHGLLAEINRQLVELTGHVRGLAHQLYPPELEVLGLVGALRERAQTHARLQVEVDAPAQLPPLPAETEAAVYFIALEALTNVEKHAAARCCRVQLRWTPDSGKQPGLLELDLVDDGTGLPPGARSGLGLLSMQARAVEAGGRCWIETPAGGGTAVHVRMPCPATSE